VRIDGREVLACLTPLASLVGDVPLVEPLARFDVVAITWPAGRRRPAIEHFPNAFEAVELGRGGR